MGSNVDGLESPVLDRANDCPYEGIGTALLLKRLLSASVN